MSDVTQALSSLQRGNPKAADDLLALLYQEIRKLAASKMAQEAPGHTLQATALVHEAWLRLVGSEQQTWQNRAHFFGAAAEAMRRILIESARRKHAARHGGGLERVDLLEVQIPEKSKGDELLEMNEALEMFAKREPQKAELVKLRYFGGLTFEEAAQVLGISVQTAKRWWSFARADLYLEILRGKETQNSGNAAKT